MVTRPESLLAPMLAEVRGRGEEYRHWWARRPAPDQTPPWSDADEELLAGLGALDPWWLGSVADELDRVRSEAREVGAALARIAEDAVGGAAAALCVRLAASSHERADAAGALATDARDAGGRVDDLLEGAARRVARDIDAHDAQDDHPPPPAGGPPQAGGQPEPDQGLQRYVTVLRLLRAELAAAIESLPALVGGPSDEWRGAEERPGWIPEPGVGPVLWIPEPGVGPVLPGTEARRVEPGYGVRIARLPDGPPG